MTQEEKELLLKDLCARLPYGLKVKCEIYSFPVTILYAGNDEVKFKETGGIENICTIKPYLFPLSSMTDKQKVEYNSLRDLVPTEQQCEIGNLLGNFEFVDNWRSIDYLNANHFDYRGLIDDGLAIDATGKNIY